MEPGFNAAATPTNISAGDCRSETKDPQPFQWNIERNRTETGTFNHRA